MKEYSDKLVNFAERSLLLTWLLKDFGWMTTNIYFGFPFGILSILFHLIIFFFDNRKSFLFYNTSLLLWVCGNFIWMTVEFIENSPSSEIHFGPHLPLGGVSTGTLDQLITIKTVLFLLSTLVQILMYIFLYLRLIPVPEEDDEDPVSKNEAYKLFFNQNEFISTFEDNSIIDFDDDSLQLNVSNTNASVISVTLIENVYILFWVSKDLFWSWGTGDLTQGRGLAIFYEVLAIFFGSMALFVYILTSFINRKNKLRLLDCLTTVFWISANFVWMCGEFFLRYDNLELDDSNQGNDTITRILSVILFLIGILIQLVIVSRIVLFNFGFIKDILKDSSIPSSQIELSSIKSPFKYKNMMISFSPQDLRDSGSSNNEEDESTILF